MKRIEEVRRAQTHLSKGQEDELAMAMCYVSSALPPAMFCCWKGSIMFYYVIPARPFGAAGLLSPELSLARHFLHRCRSSNTQG